jgi:hypothetical protein
MMMAGHCSLAQVLPLQQRLLAILFHLKAGRESCRNDGRLWPLFGLDPLVKSKDGYAEARNRQRRQVHQTTVPATVPTCCV